MMDSFCRRVRSRYRRRQVYYLVHRILLVELIGSAKTKPPVRNNGTLHQR
jgi:hypothetical protein